jgi:hypothetical protein
MNAKVNISNRAGASFPVRRMDFEFAQVPDLDQQALDHFEQHAYYLQRTAHLLEKGPIMLS